MTSASFFSEPSGTAPPEIIPTNCPVLSNTPPPDIPALEKHSVSSILVLNNGTKSSPLIVPTEKLGVFLSRTAPTCMIFIPENCAANVLFQIVSLTDRKKELLHKYPAEFYW